MKKKIFKCENCGSSDFKQLSDDLFECAYCSAKIQNDNSVKENFLHDLEGAKFRQSIKFIKASIGEEEFYKKALAHLAINKHAPNDLLSKGKFGFVRYDYQYFAVVDVDFTVMNVGARKSDLVSLSCNQKVNSNIGKNFCIELSENTDNAYMNEILEYIEDFDFFSQNVTSVIGKNGNINLPEKDVVEKKIEYCLTDYKRKLLDLDKSSNHVVHKVYKIDIFALPVYTLSFEYNGKQYHVSSSACKFNIVGDFPHDNELKKKVEKKILPFTILSNLLSLGAIIFAIVNLSLRLLRLVKYDIILAGAALLGFGVSYLAYKIVYKKISKKEFQHKKECLTDILRKNGKSLSQRDNEYIQKFLRWF